MNESLRTKVPDIQSTTCLSGVQCVGDQICPSGHEVTGHHINARSSFQRDWDHRIVTGSKITGRFLSHLWIACYEMSRL